MASPITELAVLEEELAAAAGDNSPEGLEYRQKIRLRIRQLGHLSIHPDCRRRQWVVPLDVSGNPFKMNGEVYEGHLILWDCEIRELARLIDANQRGDMARMKEHGRTYSVGTIANRGAQIPVEELA